MRRNFPPVAAAALWQPIGRGCGLRQTRARYRGLPRRRSGGHKRVSPPRPGFDRARGAYRWGCAATEPALSEVDYCARCAHLVGLAILMPLSGISSGPSTMPGTHARQMRTFAMARRPCTFRKNDVVRALKAAQTAGVPNPRVEIDLRHGTISIIPGEAPRDNCAANPLDQWISSRADHTEGH
jgi:hypothetical protein